jgi:hypothetical protein
MYSSFMPSERPLPRHIGLGEGWAPVTAANIDLADQFFANPWGPHGPELQYLLNRMRSAPTAGKLALQVIEPYRKWRLVRLPRRRGERLEPLEGQIFTSLAAAECAAFAIRWQDMFGVALPLQRPTGR